MKLIDIGEIVKTHGLKGWVKVKTNLESPEIVDSLQELYLKGKNGKITSYGIRAIKREGSFFYLHLANFNHIHQAELLVGCTVMMPAEKLPPRGEDEYYVHEIIGLKVLTEEGKFLGEVKEIFPTGSNDVYVIYGGGREILIPAIDLVIRNINLIEGTMTINLLEGL